MWEGRGIGLVILLEFSKIEGEGKGKDLCISHQPKDPEMFQESLKNPERNARARDAEHFGGQRQGPGLENILGMLSD